MITTHYIEDPDRNKILFCAGSFGVQVGTLIVVKERSSREKVRKDGQSLIHNENHPVVVYNERKEWERMTAYIDKDGVEHEIPDNGARTPYMTQPYVWDVAKCEDCMALAFKGGKMDVIVFQLAIWPKLEAEERECQLTVRMYYHQLKKFDVTIVDRDGKDMSIDDVWAFIMEERKRREEWKTPET